MRHLLFERKARIEEVASGPAAGLLVKRVKVARRCFLLGAAALAAARLARAQVRRPRRLGLLATTDEKTVRPFFLDAFLAGMRDLGYELERDLKLDIRYARGEMSRLPALADELIALGPDVLLGIEPAVIVLAGKTSSIPIVLAGSSDPVAAGLVKSLAQPGTNVTGMAHLYHDLVAKQIELLLEMAPATSRVALLTDSTYPSRERFEQQARVSATAKGLRLTIAPVQDAEGVRRAFERFTAERADGIIVGASGTMVFLRHEIMRQAEKARIPAIYAQSDTVREGGLASYGADLPASYRRDVPRFVDRILKGEKPSDLPIQRTTKYELAINLKAARDIGLSIPKSIVLRADEVIE
jgi:putative tryptophan/tyrosine transport system substrate-binding protein